MTTPNFAFSSLTPEWYTPEKYLVLVKRVIGDISLDPASNEYANTRVRAEKYFTIDDDGLKQEWKARSIFLNPPYGKLKGKSLAGIFLNKMISEYYKLHFKEGIALVNANTEAKWFQPLWEFPICFTDHRIHFETDPESKIRKQPTQGSAFIYLGVDVKIFYNTFSEIGHICLPDYYYTL